MTAELRSPSVAEVRQLNVPLLLITVVGLLPYVQIGPLSAPSQVQPWAALLAWIWVAYRVLKSGLRVSPLQWVVLALSVFFMIYTYGGQGFDFALYLRRTSVYLLGAGTLLASQYLNPVTLWRALKITTPLWLAFGVLRYVSPEIYYTVVKQFVPEVVISANRGTSSLAPEATDFGFTMVFIVVLCLITRHYLAVQGLAAERWPLYFAIISVLLSLSGAGYLGLAVVGAMYALNGLRAAFLVIGAAAFLTLLAPFASQLRGVQLLYTAIQSPAALISDTTVSYRVVHATVGALGMVASNFLGYGAGSFKSEAPMIYYQYDLGNVFGLQGWYAYNVPASLMGGYGSSQIATILLEFGVLGLLYLTLVYGFAVQSRMRFKAIAIAILILAWAGSFTVAWPPFWILLGTMISPYFAPQETQDDDSRHPAKLSM